jgi:hypothetical protein
MTSPAFRIESSHALVGPLLPEAGKAEFLMDNRNMAIAVAAKSDTLPYGQEIRVVYVPTGEIVFRKTAAPLAFCAG